MPASVTATRTRRAIYEFVRERGLATKNDISRELGLSLPTVSKYLNEFRQQNLIEKKAKLSSGAQGGRSPIGYACVAGGRLSVGVDVTRDGVTCLIVDLARDVVVERTVPRAYERSDAYCRFVAEAVGATIEESGVDARRILGVGIAMPGLISEATGRVTYGRVLDNLGMSAEDFGRHLPYPTRLVHDSDAAGRAEFWSETVLENAFYISLSRSVGGSVLVRGRIHRGDGEFAGEIGHLHLHDDGERCYCGQYGCLDPYCNATVLTAAAGGSLERFFRGLDAGDPELLAVWDRYTSDLARALHSIRALFGCTIILGGDVGPLIRGHIDGIRDKVDRISFLNSNAESFLVASRYSDQPVATGAALSFVDEFRRSLGPLGEDHHPSASSSPAAPDDRRRSAPAS
ncbi:ROK family transcriptional regulator [Mycetocola reblochoni]|uniref:Predicted N-acetyl-glucosamine kinase 2, ROK family n=2 Tax=Mycetocola reblochoni TaxID=331618 RepID=A0A1R4KCE2_9MICO|nr:ROK family transcriptional regulator [Mycetocola reblochoni]SJN41683.1 Predicted N-acetyl-glucosamine kinase 2, ROK family [Mycetocola reblochoni REB411]